MAAVVAPRPAVKVAVKPAVKVAVKPAVKVAVKPGAKVARKPAAKPTVPPAAKVAPKAAAKPAAKVGPKSRAKPAATGAPKATEIPVAKSTPRSAPSPIIKKRSAVIQEIIKHDAGDHTKDTAPLGAHVSVAGGIWEAANRCVEISSTASQIFTKQANRWVEREVDDSELTRYRTGMGTTTVRWTCAHDSYLINLASPDPTLRARSIESFRCELRRCHALGLDALVSHPGNFIDDRDAGLARNADAIAEALEAEVGSTHLLMELTAGQGTVLGSTFEEMAALIEAVPKALRSRIGVCLDTAHVWAAGYNLINDYDGVIQQFDDVIGLSRLKALHLNDSKAKLGSHLDRHELIGEGTIGAQPFRRIMTDDRIKNVPRVIETPKGDNHAAADSRMLARLRSYAAGL